MGFYNSVFAQFYDPFMKGFEKRIRENRLELLKNVEGDLLEIGSGTGINFGFYKPGINLTAIEPSQAMIDVSTAKNCNCNKLRLLKTSITSPHIFSELKEESFDYILSTLVLCTIDRPDIAIKNYRKLLKPKGKLLILEHIHSTKPLHKKLQNLANPLWKAFSEGCNLNRNTDKLLMRNGFVPVHSEYFVKTLRFVQGVYVIG
ncbi:MAG: class I SAM-dependent methyltransferase [Chlorobi bacterium]|nr:class I SAM-dependent methyltransferase [Chlorobiota bacterium]